jgi:hypothetical protein
MATRKLSRVSANEMALLHTGLEGMFHKFKDGSIITCAPHRRGFELLQIYTPSKV